MSELRKLLEAAKGTPFGSVERGKVTENLVLNAETYAGLVDDNKRLEERVAELEAEVERLKATVRYEKAFNEQFSHDNATLRARLEAVEGLPDKWREGFCVDGLWCYQDHIECAHELEAALQGDGGQE